MQPSYGISTLIKSIGIEILPASIYSMPCYFRKWGQIKIWTYGAMTFFNFWSLNLPICRRPHFSRFLWHRITLRVWMWTSCSTSHAFGWPIFFFADSKYQEQEYKNVSYRILHLNDYRYNKFAKNYLWEHICVKGQFSPEGRQ